MGKRKQKAALAFMAGREHERSLWKEEVKRLRDSNSQYAAGLSLLTAKLDEFTSQILGQLANERYLNEQAQAEISRLKAQLTEGAASTK